jgi:hypothetical protein
VPSPSSTGRTYTRISSTERGGQALCLCAEVAEGCRDHLRGDCSAQFATGGPVPLTGAFHCTSEHMASDERQDDRMPLDNGVLAILGKQVEQPAALASQSSVLALESSQPIPHRFGD